MGSSWSYFVWNRTHHQVFPGAPDLTDTEYQCAKEYYDDCMKDLKSTNLFTRFEMRRLAFGATHPGHRIQMLAEAESMFQS